MKPPRSSTSEPNLAATPQTFHETRCLNLRLQVKMPLRLIEEIDGAGRRRHEIKEAFDLPLLVDGVLDFLLSSLVSPHRFFAGGTVGGGERRPRRSGDLLAASSEVG